MKKTLIAMAVLAAASAASAQSSVTLFGRIDAGLQSKTIETTNAAGATTKDKTTTVFGGQDTVTGSRIGLTGSEDLGSGLKALFTYETALNLDRWSNRTTNTISQDGFGAVRQGFVGLQGGFGLIKVGTQYNATDWTHGVRPDIAPALANTYVNNEAAGYLASNGRSQDALSYAGQFNVGGSNTVSFGLGANQGKRTLTDAAGAEWATKGTGLTAGAGFSAFGAEIRMSYAQYKGTSDGAAAVAPTLPSTATTYCANPTALCTVTTPGAAAVAAVPMTDVKATDMSLGVKYEIAGVRPYFIYEQGKVTNNIATAAQITAGADTGKRTGMELGVGATFGAVDAWADIMQGTTKNSLGKTDKTKGFGLGAQYNLSKRTGVYGLFSNVKGTTYNAVTGNETGASSKNQSLGLGLIHKF